VLYPGCCWRWVSKPTITGHKLCYTRDVVGGGGLGQVDGVHVEVLPSLVLVQEQHLQLVPGAHRLPLQGAEQVHAGVAPPGGGTQAHIYIYIYIHIYIYILLLSTSIIYIGHYKPLMRDPNINRAFRTCIIQLSTRLLTRRNHLLIQNRTTLQIEAFKAINKKKTKGGILI
jgi:hypothetical protein